MKPIEKTSEELFQKLRNRFNPISMGDENADETATPSEARIFNFMYKENDNDIGYISISIIDNRSFKIYFGTDVADRVEDKTSWYNFLKELRMFAKRNLMSFDARDLAKNQLEPRDFKFISNQDGTYKDHEVEVSESAMFGSRRKSYQTMENVKMIVHHRKSIDETKPGARSRCIESIYLERADGERYKFPYNYLTGARAMARHVNEGGNPYDDAGKHIIGMIKEMKDLSKFARRTKKHAMEDEAAGGIRTSVVERFHNMKKKLSAMSVKEGYAKFLETLTGEETLAEDDSMEQLKERFTQQVFDAQLEDTLPSVMRAIKEAEMNKAAAADKSIDNLILKPLVLRKDDSADQMFRSTKFTDGNGLLGFILSDIASRAIGDDADVVANFASDAAERIHDREFSSSDKQTAMKLAKKYMDDVKKMSSDPSYADQIRVDSKDMYGAKKKRGGGFHEAEQYESWANEIVPEDSIEQTVEAKKPIKKPIKKDFIDIARDWGYGFRKLADYEKPNHLVGQEAYLITYTPDNQKYDEFDQELGDFTVGEIKDVVLQHASKHEPELLKYVKEEQVNELRGKGDLEKIKAYHDNRKNVANKNARGMMDNTGPDSTTATFSGEMGKADVAKANSNRAGKLIDRRDARNPNKTNESGFYRDNERTGSAEGAKRAILWRIQNQHTDLLKQYGVDKVMQMVDDEAMYLDNLEEIGSSDISAWVNNIKRNLAADYSEVAAKTNGESNVKEAAGKGQSDSGRYAFDDNGVRLSNSGYRQKFTWDEINQMLKGRKVRDFSRDKSSPYNDKNIAVFFNGEEEYHLPLNIVPGRTAAAPPKGPQTYRDYMGWGEKKVKEAVTTGTVGTSGTAGTTTSSTNPAQAMRDPKLQQAAKNVSRVAQSAGIKTNPNQVAQTLAGQQLGKAPTPKDKSMASDFGNKLTSLASDPKNAAKLQTLMKQMVVQGKFDESAVRDILTKSK